MSTQIDDLITRRYPYPLAATYYRTFHKTRNMVLIHRYLLDLFEVTVKYLAAIMLAQYIRDVVNDPTINSSLRQLQRPSLGHWQGWLRDILRLYQKQKRPLLIPELAAFYEQKNTGEMYTAYMSLRQMMTDQMEYRGDGKNPASITTQQFFELIGTYRNKLAHGATLSDYDQERVARMLMPAFREMFGAMAFISEYGLVYINEVKLVPSATRRGMRYEHCYTELNSDSTSEQEPKALDEAVALPNAVYILAKGQEFAPVLSLHPFIIFRRCDRCSDDQVFVLNTSSDNTLTYLSYQCSHQFSLTEYKDVLDDLLRDLGVGEAITLVSPPSEAEVREAEQAEAQRQTEAVAREQEDRVAAAAVAQVQATQATLAAQVESATATGRQHLETQVNQLQAKMQAMIQQQAEREAQREEADRRQQEDAARQRIAAQAATALVCSACQRLNPMGRKFCSGCGTRLNTGPLTRSSGPGPAVAWASSGPTAGPGPSVGANYVAPVPPPVAPVAPTGAIVTCPKCGRTYAAGRKFCTIDGTGLLGLPATLPPDDGATRPLGDLPPLPDHPITSPPATAGEVAAPSLTCANCGQGNPPGRKFCNHCGRPMAAPPPPNPPQPVAALPVEVLLGAEVVEPSTPPDSSPVAPPPQPNKPAPTSAPPPAASKKFGDSKQ